MCDQQLPDCLYETAIVKHGVAGKECGAWTVDLECNPWNSFEVWWKTVCLMLDWKQISEEKAWFQHINSYVTWRISS